MKKFVSLMLAVALVLTSVASFAFIVPAASESTKQVQLIAVMPVDVQTTNPGVKSYTEIVDTTKIYQANDLITIATIVEMKNLAKNTLLTSVEGKRIDIRLSSTTVDLSYGMLAPSFVYNIYGANNWGTSTIASNTLAITGATAQSGKSSIKYDSATGTVTLKVKAVGNGTSAYYMSDKVFATGNAINQGGVNGVQDGIYIAGAVQAFAPFNGWTGKAWGSGDPCVYIPAINSKNVNDFVAPTAVQYALIMTGITKPATTGDMKAEMLVSSKEEFEDITGGLDIYYPINRKQAPLGQEVVEAQKLEIGKTYTVIRLFGKRANLAVQNRDDVTNYLKGLGYEFVTKEADLVYRTDAGTMDIYQIYKYDGDKDNHAGDFVVNLITEVTSNDFQAAKGLWAADADLAKLSFNENKYYYANDNSLIDTSRPRYATQYADKLAKFAVAPYSGYLTTAYSTGVVSVAATNVPKNLIPTGLNMPDYEGRFPWVGTTVPTTGAAKFVQFPVNAPATATDLGFAVYAPATALAPAAITYVDSALNVMAAAPGLIAGVITSDQLAAMTTASALVPYTINNVVCTTSAQAAAATAAFYSTNLLYNSGDLYDNDSHGAIARSSGKKSGDIKDALAFFAIPLGVNNTNKIVKDTFTAVAASAVWSEAVTNTYSYGTITIIEDVVDEGTEEEVIEEEVIEEEVEEEEFVEEEVEEVVVPVTGDFSANVAVALIASAIVAAAALAFVTRKAR